MDIMDYRCRVGVAFFGGCGSNVLRLIIDEHDPKDYPDFFLFGANTDAKVHQLHFGKAEDEKQKLWMDTGALKIHQLGGEEVTKGRGAGAKPEVGRRAAETDHSVEAMRIFFGSVDELFLVGAVGGGTGTGALPVAAKLAVEMGKPTLAIIVIPEPEDGRNKRATEALADIQSLVTTVPIRNAYLKEVMKEMPEEDRARLTYPEAWKIVNEHSLVPMLLIIREIVQVTGDIVNSDQADWETMLGYGKQAFFGLAEIEPAAVPKTSAEEIADELFAARFQDSGVIEQGKVIGMWSHGPWPVEKTNDIRRLVKGRVAAGDSAKEEELEVHRGIVHNVADNKMWIAVIIVGGESPKTKAVTPAISMVKLQTKAATDSKKPLDQTARSRSVPSMIRFRSNGTMMEIGVTHDLAFRFNSTMGNVRSTREELETIFREVEGATGHLPNMPEKFIDKSEEKKTGILDIAANIFQRRKMSAN